MKWASCVSVDQDLEQSVAEVAAGIADALGGTAPDLLFAFASPDIEPDLAGLPARLMSEFPGSKLIGCTGGGVIGGGREVEGKPALSLTGAVLPGVKATTFHLGPNPDDWPAAVGIDPDAIPHFVVLPEPFTNDTQLTLRWFDLAYTDSLKIGGVASGSSSPGGNALFVDDRFYTGGAAGVGLVGNIEMASVVAQGCRPIGSPLFVTRCERNVVHELDGRPAVEAVQQLYGSLPPRDQELFRSSLFLGLVMREQEQCYGQGDFLIRNLTGIDPDQGAVVVGALVRENQVVQFHLRDAETATHDLNTMLRKQRGVAGATPEGALLFSCLGRGERLYDVPDHDSSLFREHFGPAPLGGFFCNGEIGPVQGTTFLHGFTSSFGLFRSATDSE
jgi:small ligand-binding sensory domain FIST